MYTPFNDEIQIRIRINHSPFECCVNDTLDRRERKRETAAAALLMRERERGKKILTFERWKHGSFVECSLLEMN
jgi:hypothetical protein